MEMSDAEKKNKSMNPRLIEDRIKRDYIQSTQIGKYPEEWDSIISSKKIESTRSQAGKYSL